MPPIAFYESHRSSSATVIEATWGEVVEMLSTVTETPCGRDETGTRCAGGTCPHKFSMAWSPVDLLEPHRANANVRAVTFAVFDVDHVTPAELLRVAERLDGWEYVVHSTHSHRANLASVRVVMPLSRPVPAAQWRTVLAAAVRLLDIPADPACKDLSRLYFLPTCPEGEDRIAERGTGKVLDVDALLASASADVPASLAETPEPLDVEDEPLPGDVEPTDLEALRDRLREVRYSYARKGDTERHGLLDAILRGEPLASPGGRDNTINQAASILACSLPPHTPREAALEVMRPALSAMDVDPEGLPHWLDRAGFSYDRSMARRIERDAQRELDNAQIRQGILGLFATSREIASDPAEDVTRGPQAAAPNAPMTDEELIAHLLWNADRTALRNCGANVNTILAHSLDTRGTLRWNEVTKTIEVVGGPFAHEPLSSLDVAVNNWLQRKWGLQVKLPEIGAQLAYVARTNAYDPLAEYLDGVVWDGTPRASHLLTRYFGAVATDADGRDTTAHLERVGRKWLISAVARALSPGCQVDNILVLEGAQGIRKSTAFRVLGGPWACDSQIALGDKDTKMLAACSWIIELAELAAFKKSETEAHKAFITSPKDRFRPPYARSMEDFPRRCVFVGTTNDDDYLTDPTGNRRYWPVRCTEIDVDALAADRDQLWAEAVAAYRAGESWWFDAAESAVAEEVAAERVDQSPIVSKVVEWWFSLAPSRRPDHLTSAIIAEQVLMEPTARISRGLQMQIGNALRTIGMKRARRLVGGVRVWVYVPTPRALEAPQVKAMVLASTPGAGLVLMQGGAS